MRINCLRAKMVCNESKNYSRKCSATLLNVGHSSIFLTRLYETNTIG